MARSCAPALPGLVGFPTLRTQVQSQSSFRSSMAHASSEQVGGIVEALALARVECQ